MRDLKCIVVFLLIYSCTPTKKITRIDMEEEYPKTLYKISFDSCGNMSKTEILSPSNLKRKLIAKHENTLIFSINQVPSKGACIDTIFFKDSSVDCISNKTHNQKP